MKYETIEKVLAAEKETKEFTVRITGAQAIQRFRNLIELFEKLGSWGSSRTVKTWWDGDGPDKLEILNDSDVPSSITKEELNQATQFDTVSVGDDGIKGLKKGE